jgi:hypothetical protein
MTLPELHELRRLMILDAIKRNWPLPATTKEEL